MKTLLLFSFLFTAACTSSFTVKNKVLVLSAEKFDNSVETRAKASFVDAEQQKVFAEFVRKNTRIDVKSFEMKGETEATGELAVKTFPKTLDQELAKISGKDWQTKVDASMETKTYPITMKKTDVWQMTGFEP